MRSLGYARDDRGATPWDDRSAALMTLFCHPEERSDEGSEMKCRKVKGKVFNKVCNSLI